MTIAYNMGQRWLTAYGSDISRINDESQNRVQDDRGMETLNDGSPWTSDGIHRNPQ